MGRGDGKQIPGHAQMIAMLPLEQRTEFFAHSTHRTRHTHSLALSRTHATHATHANPNGELEGMTDPTISPDVACVAPMFGEVTPLRQSELFVKQFGGCVTSPLMWSRRDVINRQRRDDAAGPEFVGGDGGVHARICAFARWRLRGYWWSALCCSQLCSDWLPQPGPPPSWQI